MPIKRMSKMSEAPEAMEAPESSKMEDAEESTATLDASILQGQEVSPGDRIELEVVSVDPEMGSVTVKYPGESESKPEEGIPEMASEYDKAPA